MNPSAAGQCCYGDTMGTRWGHPGRTRRTAAVPSVPPIGCSGTAEPPARTRGARHRRSHGGPRGRVTQCHACPRPKVTPKGRARGRVDIWDRRAAKPRGRQPLIRPGRPRSRRQMAVRGQRDPKRDEPPQPHSRDHRKGTTGSKVKDSRTAGGGSLLGAGRRWRAPGWVGVSQTTPPPHPHLRGPCSTQYPRPLPPALLCGVGRVSATPSAAPA